MAPLNFVKRCFLISIILVSGHILSLDSPEVHALNQKGNGFDALTDHDLHLRHKWGAHSVRRRLKEEGFFRMLQHSQTENHEAHTKSNSDNFSTAPALLPGFLAVRFFPNGGTCPWTDTPAEDEECIERQDRYRAMKDSIAQCEAPLARSGFAVAHRGAPLAFPEHSIESYEAAAAMGASFIECDVAITKDLQLVCRHSQCDLATTTDILEKHPDMLAQCSVPFSPAKQQTNEQKNEVDSASDRHDSEDKAGTHTNTDEKEEDANDAEESYSEGDSRSKTAAGGSGNHTPATVTCCTYDFSLAELKQLKGIMEVTQTNASATSPDTYLLRPPRFRSRAVPDEKLSGILTHREMLQWASNKSLAVIPELKDTFLQETNNFLASQNLSVFDFADLLVAELEAAGFVYGIDDEKFESKKAIIQSFDWAIVRYLKNTTVLPVLYLYQQTEEGFLEPEPPESGGGARSNVSALTHKRMGLEAESSTRPMEEVRFGVSERILREAAALGVEFVGPPLWDTLVTDSASHGIALSETAKRLQTLDFGIIPWTLERSECPDGTAGPCGGYYASTGGASVFDDSDLLLVLYELKFSLGAYAVFSDYPVTTAVFDNCVSEVRSEAQ